MIVGHKNILKYIIISIIFLAAISIGTISHGIYNPSDAAFLSANAESILGQNLSSGSAFWNRRLSRGELSCFYHAGQGGMATRINSVYTMDFDNVSGFMKVESVINDPSIANRTTIAHIDAKFSVGNLVAETSKSNNAKNVYKALYHAMQSGKVIRDSVLAGVQGWWKNGLENPASQESKDLYNNYKKITKETTEKAPTEQEDTTVTINDKEYTIVGPFKATFRGKGISKVTINDGNEENPTIYAEWKSENSTDIYWSKNISSKASDWSNNFNKKREGKTYQFELSNATTAFYLAIETSKLENIEESYQVTITQETFEYRRSRIVVCKGINNQQTGLYCYANDSTKVIGEISWDVDRTVVTSKYLKIRKLVKKADNSEKRISSSSYGDFGFKIYVVLDDGSKGWLSGDAEAEKTYEKSVKNATEYRPYVKIENLENGTYYIYETKAHSNYDLTEQEGYHKGDNPGASDLTGDWVYTGSKKITEDMTKADSEFDVINYRLGRMQILKIDPESDTDLSSKGAKFKIYAILNNGTKGWLSGSATGDKTLVETASAASLYNAGSVNNDGEQNVIKKLKYGTYYIYEVKAPTGYSLSVQSGYLDTSARGSSTITGNWAYLGSKKIGTSQSDIDDTASAIEFEANNVKGGIVQIVKKDAVSGSTLTGAKFKIYAVLEEQDENDNNVEGWVSGNTTGNKKYGSTQKEYSANTQITNLKYGTYYIYETKAPTGYLLNDQEGYHSGNNPGTSSITGDWVYVGKVQIKKDTIYTEANAIEIPVENKAAAKLKITKVDSIDTTKTLTGAKFKIYAVLEDGTKGWLSGSATGTKSYQTDAEKAREYSSDTEITKLRYGTYYVYETTAPTGYALSNQNGYKNTSGAQGATSLTGDWVYNGHIKLSEANAYKDNNPTSIEVIIQNNPSTSLKINKKDEKTKAELTGAKFKIYATLEDGTKGWLSGAVNADKTYVSKAEEATEYDAHVEITGLAYGTYYIYETKAPDGNYSLSAQDGYKQESTGSDTLTGDWVFIEAKKIDPNNGSGNPSLVEAENRELASLKINKKDERTKAELTGAKFKIYAVLDNGVTGWLSGNADGDKTYGEQATEYDAKVEITRLEYGTYYIYETKAPDGNYSLSSQDGYHKAEKGSDTLTGDWAFIEAKKIDQNNGSGNPYIVEAENKKLANMQIIKKDKTNGIALQGGKFKLYAELVNGKSGWLSGDVDGDKTYGTEATEYTSATTISKLEYGTYYIYETETPTGYDITKQEGYHKAAQGSTSLTGDWVYLGTQLINYNFPEDGIFKFEAKNGKVVDELEGYVWIDEPDTKANISDNIYTSSSKDYLKQGITVNLYDGSKTLIATTTTDAEGHYRFTTKNAPSYTGEDKNIYYWDLAQAYVEFIYNNKTTYKEDGSVNEYGYISVDPFEGTNISINSKAQEYTITTEKLDDNNLTGTTGNNPGRAVTYQATKTYSTTELLENTNSLSEKIKNNTASYDDLKEAPLTGYYDNNTYKVSNINLGLIEQNDPEFDVDENLEYIKVSMNGYTYTYKFGADKATQIETDFVPTARKQRSAKGFTAAIYPSDIAYSMENNWADNTLKVYAVYKIDVTNNETTNVDNKYVEQRLYLDSLTNQFDTNRYTLCNNENLSDSSDFALWTDNGNGIASYNVNADNSAYKEGMGKQETKSSYIQFRIKNDALERILERNFNEEELQEAPSVAAATGYHEYLRTDNSWIKDENVRAFSGVKGTNYPTVNGSSDKYYVHKSISKTYLSGDLYLSLELGEPRTISGTVFEDTRTAESANENTNLGNGILDEAETNRAKTVKVELLNADKQAVSTLYQTEGTNYTTKSAVTTTGDNGTYTFTGVVPGYYYIRFTYGDGSQTIMPANEAIKSSDYKSTIINTSENNSIIRNAMEANVEDLANAQQKLLTNNSDEQAKKLLEWYKYLDKSYSTAVDDINARKEIDEYEYREDGKAYDAEGNEITPPYQNISSYTPMIGISIENDIENSTNNGNEHKSLYDEFNFGIIKEIETLIIVEKKITNLDLTNQTGSTIISTNPVESTSTYVSALDSITDGSKYAKIEIDPSIIYGSELETTYEITIENKTAKDYIEEEGKPEFGTYYKYGEILETAELKKIKIEEVIDELDKKYSYDSIQEGTIVEKVINAEGTETTSEAKISKTSGQTSEENSNRESQENSDGTVIETETKTLKITGWEAIESEAKTSATYTVTSLLTTEQDDTDYLNKVRVTSISLDKLTNLKSNFEWGDNLRDETTLTITPNTGEDRSTTYWIAGTISLIVIATGFILLKKKVLK